MLWLALLAVVLAASLAAVVLEARRRLVAESRRAEAAEAARRKDSEQAAAERTRLQDLVDRHRDLLARVKRSWAAERAWNRELRAQVGHLSGARSADGDGEGDGDVRALVLRAAIKLSEADRGLMLAREDTDGDGDLDLVLSRGFRNDPRHSAVAQRFAREVLQRDQIVREDDPAADLQEATEADREIESLVAIPLYLRDRFHGVVVCANRPGGFDAVEDDVFLALGDHAGAALHQGLLNHQLQDANRATVRVLVEIAAAADPLLHRESGHLVVHAMHLARDLELSREERDVLLCAILLRAIGHVALPDDLLSRAGPLTRDEREVVELHARLGFTIVSQAPSLRDVAVAILHHHERWDGGGYPAGLAGEAIPPAARALAVLEAFGALTHQRPYRDAGTAEEACAVLIDAAGTQFDPEIVGLLVEAIRRVPSPPSDLLAESVLEALPIDPATSAAAPLGPLGAPSTDGLTMLGDHRALHVAMRNVLPDPAGSPDAAFVLIMVVLEDLPRLNTEAGFVVGDRLVQLAGRSAQRAAARLGGTAFRVSGRRFVVLVALREGLSAADAATEVEREFTGALRVRQVSAVWKPAQRPEDVLDGLRSALGEPG